MSPNKPVPRSADESNERSGDPPKALLRFRGINLVSVLVSIGAIVALILHVAEPTWKIDSIAIALLVVAALPWLGEILESIDLPGGGGVKYRERLENVEVKAADVEGQLAELREIFPLLLPDNLLVHLKNLATHSPKPYHSNDPLKDELRALRGMQVTVQSLVPGSGERGEGVAAVVRD